jgi:hypothetical protein
VLRPFISAVLNFLEVACDAIDLTLLVLIVWVYRIKAAEEAIPSQPGQEDVVLPQVCQCAGGKATLVKHAVIMWWELRLLWGHYNYCFALHPAPGPIHTAPS